MVEELRYLAYFAARNRIFLVGIVGVVISVMLLLIGPVIAPYPPTATNASASLQPPSPDHLMGTDVVGMDIFSRVLAAPRIDLLIALSATLFSFLLGTPLGVIAGYFDGTGGPTGFISQLILRTLDIIQAFPVFILALALLAALGPNTVNVILSIAFANAPVFLRLTRAEVLSVRQKTFIEAAQSVGNPDFRLMARHLLPNSLAPSLDEHIYHNWMVHTPNGRAQFRGSWGKGSHS